MIQARNIHKSFGTLKVLKGIDLDIRQGEIVSIVGKSGAGKTTLLHILGTLERPDGSGEGMSSRSLNGSKSLKGLNGDTAERSNPLTLQAQTSQTPPTLQTPQPPSLYINNVEVLSLKDRELSDFRNRHIGFVFQFHQLLPEFTALENVMMPALIAQTPRPQAKARGEELLDFLGLKDRLKHRPNELSGGEKQRVAVARALMNHPDVIFADEPSGSLDLQNKQELHQLFFDLRRQFNQTFVIVTHDEGLAEMSDRVIRMQDGRIVE